MNFVYSLVNTFKNKLMNSFCYIPDKIVVVIENNKLNC